MYEITGNFHWMCPNPKAQIHEGKGDANSICDSDSLC